MRRHNKFSGIIGWKKAESPQKDLFAVLGYKMHFEGYRMQLWIHDLFNQNLDKLIFFRRRWGANYEMKGPDLNMKQMQSVAWAGTETERRLVIKANHPESSNHDTKIDAEFFF